MPLYTIIKERFEEHSYSSEWEVVDAYVVDSDEEKVKEYVNLQNKLNVDNLKLKYENDIRASMNKIEELNLCLQESLKIPSDIRSKLNINNDEIINKIKRYGTTIEEKNKLISELENNPFKRVGNWFVPLEIKYSYEELQPFSIVDNRLVIKD